MATDVHTEEGSLTIKVDGDEFKRIFDNTPQHDGNLAITIATGMVGNGKPSTLALISFGISNGMGEKMTVSCPIPWPLLRRVLTHAIADIQDDGTTGNPDIGKLRAELDSLGFASTKLTTGEPDPKDLPN